MEKMSAVVFTGVNICLAAVTKSRNYWDIFQGFLGDLVWIDLPDLSQGHQAPW